MKLKAFLGAGASLLVSATAVNAQAAPDAGSQVTEATEAQDDSGADKDTIIVTGSSIRGIKPVGSAIVTQDREEIRDTGKNDLNQVLSALPQAENFLGLLQPGGGPRGGTANISRGSERSPVQRPNLRNIPGTLNGSGQPTLVLLDGHRLVPAGTFQAAVDPGVVPVGALARNEVLLDGASAIYGSDAVGGVINLITRKRYDGVEVNGRYGFAKDYWQRDFSVTLGKSWDTGGFLINYEYAQNTNILAGEREFTRPLNYLQAGATPGTYLTPSVTGLGCDIANVQSGTTIFHVDGAGIAAGPQYCWEGQWITYNPSQKRHSLFLAGEQQIADGVKFDMTAMFSRRSQVSNDGPIVTSSTITAASPLYRPGLPGTHTVRYSLGPLLGYDTQRSDTTIEFFNITPQITVDVGQWQVRGLVNYGQSDTSVDQVSFDTLALNALIAARVLNPYNVAASSGALSQVQGILRDVHTVGKQDYTQVRLVADGPLFTMPGGEVRVAVGGEWMQHKVEQRLTNRATFLPFPVSNATTSSKGVFGEINLPLVSEANAMPFIHGLTLAASARWDDYGEYGTTFNPRIAATFQPVDWITVRGSWSKSFRAPNAFDKLPSTIQCVVPSSAGGCNTGLQSPTFLNPRYNITAVGSTFAGLTITGTDSQLRPEKSTNWSIGVDVDPPFIPGLRLSASYWEIHFKDQISTPGQSVNTIFQNAYRVGSNLTEVCLNPAPASTPQAPNTPTDVNGACTGATLANFLAQAPGGASALAQLQASGYTLALLIDQRVTNLSSSDLAGLDAEIRYQRPTGFGSIDGRVSLSKPLQADSRVSEIRPVVDTLLTGTPDFRITAALGATIGQFRAQASWRYSASYVASEWLCRVDTRTACPATPTRRPGQIRVGEYDEFNLLFSYSFNSDNWALKDLELTLNINNVLNSHPPFSYTQTGGVIGGQTLGRLFQLGFSKKF